MKYTINNLKEGKCAVINDGTLEELNKVLFLACNDTLVFGSSTVYTIRNNKWHHNSNTVKYGCISFKVDILQELSNCQSRLSSQRKITSITLGSGVIISMKKIDEILTYYITQ